MDKVLAMNKWSYGFSEKCNSYSFWKEAVDYSLSILTIPSSICFEIRVACVQLGAGLVVASGYSSR